MGDVPALGAFCYKDSLLIDQMRTTAAKQKKRIAELEGKIANPSWSDFMEISDNFLAHYPPDIFTGASGDPAPLFVVALRKAKQALEGE